VEHLSEDAAAALAKFEGDLYFYSLTDLTEQAAVAIAGHMGELALGVFVPSRQPAESVCSPHRWRRQ